MITTGVLLATGVEIALLILTLVSIGASIAAGYLLKPGGPKESLNDEAPTTIATRGSFIPYVVGRRRVGAVFCFAGNRVVRKERVGSSPSKGGSRKSSAPTQSIFFEDGWHCLCVGPVRRMHAVYQAGKPIFSGGLSPQSHPSGATVNLGKEGSFTIYWGEEDQPLGAEVNSAIGINSRWPFACYVFWSGKRLGPAARWPIIDYEIETGIHTTHLLNTPGDVPVTVPAGVTNGGTFGATTATPRTDGIAMASVIARSRVEIGSKFTWTGTSDASRDGTYTVFSTRLTGIGSVIFTIITIEESVPVSGASISGTVTFFPGTGLSGLNHGHMAAQILFDKFPHGLGFDKAKFDLSYFENAATVVNDEAIRGSYRAEGGQSFLAFMGHLLQDMGAVMPWDVSQGKFLLRIVRAETTSPTLPEQVILDPLPQIQTVHGDFGGTSPRADKIVFEFADRTISYRAMTVVVDDDGKASRKELVNTRKVQLPTINDFASASVVAERRSQEDLGLGAVYTVYANREARLLFPGQTLIVDGIGPRLRIMAVEIDPYSGKIQINAVTDYYGAKTSTFARLTLEEQQAAAEGTEQEETPLGGDLVTSTGDGFQFYELPGYLVNGKGTNILFPRIRSHNKVPGAIMHVSADGVTYRSIDIEQSLQTGGELTSVIAIDDAFVIEQSATFLPLGPDIAQIEDLTGDDPNWYGGRQVAIINDEIFFIRNVTALTEISYRLDGLIRARFDTERQAHAVGDMVRIFTMDSQLVFTDLLVKPGSTLYLKAQPTGGIAEIDLDFIPVMQQVIVGKGVRPMKPAALRTETLRDTWPVGEPVRLKWGYRSTEFPGTGAGMQGAGNPTGCSAVEGEFVLEMKTTGDVLKATYVTSKPYMYYYNADLVSDFDGEPPSFKVVLTHVHGGLKSDSIEITVAQE